MKLWLIADHQGCRYDFLETLEQAARAGLAAIILREKELRPAPLYELALQVKELADRHGVELYINGSVEVAMAVQAQGVHLGQDALPPPVVRRQLAYRGRVGLSVHTAAAARQAHLSGVDYLLAGTVFKTASKPGVKPSGIEYVAGISRATSLPVVAVGGINPANAALLQGRGFAGIAVRSYILAADDPYRAVVELQRALVRK